MRVQNINTRNINFIPPGSKQKEIRSSENPIGTTTLHSDRFQLAFGNGGNHFSKLKGLTLAGLLGVASIAPTNLVAQQAKKINQNAVIYKIEEDDLEPELINSKEAKYKKYVSELDSIYDRQKFLKTWEALPNSSKILYEDVEDQLATTFIKDEMVPAADSLGIETLKKGLNEIPNKKKNPVILSVLKATNEALKDNSPENPVKEIFNPKLLSPRKYKFFVDINYIIKEHLVFGKNNRLISSVLPYSTENVKKAKKEFKVLNKEADFVDYVYKASYKNLINKLIHR